MRISVLISQARAQAGSIWERARSRPGRALLAGTAWSLTGSVAARTASLAATLVLVRVLSKDGLGRYAIVMATAATFQALADLGLGITAIKHVSQSKDVSRERTSELLGALLVLSAGAGLFFGSLLALAAPIICKLLLSDATLTTAVRLCAVGMMFGTFNGVQNGILAGLESFKGLARLGIASALLAAGLTVGGAHGLGLNGAIAGAAVAGAVMSVVTQLVLSREVRARGLTPSLRGLGTIRPIIWRFSVPALLAGLMVAPVNWACATLLVRQPAGFAELAVFNAANQWFTLLILIPAALSQALLPALSREGGAGKESTQLDFAVSTMKLVAVFALPVLTVACLFSRQIMGAYGPGFADAWPVLAIALTTAAVFAIVAPLGNLLAASDRMWLGLALNAAWAAAMIVAVLWLIPFGALGLALARLSAYALHGLWCWIALTRIRPRRGDGAVLA